MCTECALFPFPPMHKLYEGRSLVTAVCLLNARSYWAQPSPSKALKYLTMVDWYAKNSSTIVGLILIFYR